MQKLSLLLLALCVLLAAPLAASAQNEEYIIVSGGVSLHQWEKYKDQPHDLWWMNFVRAARLRIQELQAERGQDYPIAWFVFADAYKTRSRQENAPLMSHIMSVRDAYGVKLHFFDKTQELVDYMNNGRPRDRVKISGFEYFGHSNKACFMFDYSNKVDSASKVWLHENELRRIRRGIFARNAHVKSWGCHTGESMSKKWYSATGVRMIGAIGKTQYRTEELPFISTSGGRWVQ